MQNFAWVAFIAACSGAPDATLGPDAPPASPDAAVLLPCAAQTLCLKPFLVTPTKPVTAGFLTVVWFQPMHVNGLPTMPTELAYAAPFVPGKPRYDIPLAQIHAPVSDNVLLCQWDQAGCHRQALIPAIGFGLPLVLDDTNGNGKIDPAEITFYGNHGAGMAYLAWSQVAHPPGDRAVNYSDGTTTYLGDIFTQGIGQGVRAYPLVPAGFDSKLGAIDAANGADLALCPGQGTTCNVSPPRLAGTSNP